MKVGAAAQKLGLSMQTYATWEARARQGKLTIVDAHRMQATNQFARWRSFLVSVFLLVFIAPST
jgi:hypothetical protein